MFGMSTFQGLLFSYYLLTDALVVTFTAVLVFLLLQISLYYFKSKLLINIYLVLIYLISFPWFLSLSDYIFTAIRFGRWSSLVFKIILPEIHLLLFPIVSILIHLSYSKKVFGGKAKYSKEE